MPLGRLLACVRQSESHKRRMIDPKRIRIVSTATAAVTRRQPLLRMGVPGVRNYGRSEVRAFVSWCHSTGVSSRWPIAVCAWGQRGRASDADSVAISASCIIVRLVWFLPAVHVTTHHVVWLSEPRFGKIYPYVALSMQPSWTGYNAFLLGTTVRCTISVISRNRYACVCVCVCVCVFVWLRISPQRIKLAVSNFSRRFIGVQGRESFLWSLLPEAKKRWTGVRAGHAHPHVNITVEMCRRKRHATDAAPFVKARGVWT